MNASKDYYRILEAHPRASVEVIERAKRVLLQRYHPDHNRQREEWAANQTRLVLEAFEVLSDPVKRKDYDDARRERRQRAQETARAARGRRPTAKRGSARKAAPQKPKARAGRRPEPFDLRDVPEGMRVVACPTCGQPSRVRADRALTTLKCGACGAPLRFTGRQRLMGLLRRIDDRLERARARLLRFLSGSNRENSS